MDYDNSIYSTCAFCKQEMILVAPKQMAITTDLGEEYEDVGDIYFCENDRQYTLHNFATDMCSTMSVADLKDSILFKEINDNGNLEYKDSLFLFLLNLRQENGEWIQLMASKLNIEAKELSDIEDEKIPMPEGFMNKIESIYKSRY